MNEILTLDTNVMKACIHKQIKKKHTEFHDSVINAKQRLYKAIYGFQFGHFSPGWQLKANNVLLLGKKRPIYIFLSCIWNDASVMIILVLGSSERHMFLAFSLHVKGCIWS